MSDRDQPNAARKAGASLMRRVDANEGAGSRPRRLVESGGTADCRHSEVGQFRWSHFAGIFIAALAAVSTFDRHTLDDLMPAPAPRLELRTRGQDETVDLTMRMFLTHLFAYLTTYSFLLALICVICEALAPSFGSIVERWEC